MQEQVCANARNITKIKDYLDGIQIEDKLVVVGASSGTISDKNLAILMQPLAFISYDNGVYIKVSESLTEIVFKLCSINAAEVGSAYFNIGGTKVVITKSTKAYVIQSDPIITTYSKSQIDSIINNVMALMNGKASLTGATFTGAVKAPTFEQSEPNVSISFNFSTGSADIQITNAYNRLIVVNGILYAIANIKMKNISGANKNIGAAWGGTPFIAVSLPADVASKIYDIDGVSAHEVGTARKLITSVHASCISGTTGDAGASTYNDFRFDLTNTASANQVACYFNANQYITLAPDEEITLMARVAITLF